MDVQLPHLTSFTMAPHDDDVSVLCDRVGCLWYRKYTEAPDVLSIVIDCLVHRKAAH